MRSDSSPGTDSIVVPLFTNIRRQDPNNFSDADVEMRSLVYLGIKIGILTAYSIYHKYSAHATLWVSNTFCIWAPYY